MVSISGAAKKNEYYRPFGHLVIIPIENILMVFSGLLIVLMVILLILKGYRKKKAQHQFQNRISGIKYQFNLIKGDALVDEDDDWLEYRRKQDSNHYNNYLGMNKKY
ncbi:MAG: hypothetical protein LLF83_04540 [Methanobacterium sp.]|nr:hypothetical protein [Methanobacterium sp.]